MKTLFAKHKWMQIVYGVLLLVAGILIIVFAFNDKDNISKWLSIVAAITLFVYSAALLFTGIFSLKDKYFDMSFVFAVIFIAIGVVLLSNTTIMGQFITVFVSTLFIALGVIEIGEATAMIFFKRPIPSIIIFYVLGVVFLTLGILAISFKEEVEQIIYIGVGGIACVVAVIQLVLGVVGTIKDAKAKKMQKQSALDAEVIVEAPEQIEVKEEPQA